MESEEVENEALSQLGLASANMNYCSQVLENQDDSDGDLDDDDDEDQNMEVLDQETCTKLSGVKRTLLPFLDGEAGSGNNSKVNKEATDVMKKSKWGPIVAPRKSARNHGHVSIVDKAKEYQKKRNLEVPKSFKGNSFALLESNVLGS